MIDSRQQNEDRPFILPLMVANLRNLPENSYFCSIFQEYHMKKVKITVLKTMLNEDLAKEYGICGLKACPMMKVGDVFYADYAKPDGFCDEAWKAIYQYVFALAHGADKGLFYYGDWIKEPGVAIVSCNDGLRPVIMKLEATDEEATIDYTPVER